MNFVGIDDISFHGRANVAHNETCSRELEKIVEAMKGAVAMDMRVIDPFFIVSLYRRNGATRKARCQLSATTMSSEQSRTQATGESVWLGIERYAALFKHGTRHDFDLGIGHYGRPDDELAVHNFARKFGSLIAQNANLVECLRIGAESVDSTGFCQQFLSLDVWKEAFPSLQGAYLILGNFYHTIEVSPHLMKHVRGLAKYTSSRGPAYLDLTRNMIRNKDYVIEEIEFHPHLPYDAKLLDDALRTVRSFKAILNEAEFGLLARSFERTKAEGDKLERVSIAVCTQDYFNVKFAVETIVRSRPNLQVLNLEFPCKISAHHFVPLCNFVASSTLTAFICNWCHEDLTGVEGVADVVGKLLQHSTIRDFRLTFDPIWCVDSPDHDNFVQGVAEGLRATRLRRFHLTMSSYDGASIASMTKLYESVRENRSLMDIQLKGRFWHPWGEWRHGLSHLHLSFFEFLSSRNQYLSQLLMPYEHTLPVGLWPLILESASCNASILYYLLTFQPHLVKGKVEGTVAADRECDVDGPAHKCKIIWL